jgi:L-2,4-diaminobutyrate decarboxylase
VSLVVSDLEQAVEVALAALTNYVRDSVAGCVPAITLRPVNEVIDRLELRHWLRRGNMTPDSFARFLEAYLENTTRLHHPAYLAHQVAPPDAPAAVADLIHGTINNPMMVYEMGPAGVAVELVVLDWMLEKVGWQGTGAGILTHGGSLGNLTALLAARTRAEPDSWTHGMTGKSAILAPRSCHYSIRRAAAILGFGEHGVIPIDTDSLERIIPESLPRALDRARAAGLRPSALVANACATGTGLYDALQPTAAFCREQGLWLHVDAAHGASALLSPRHRSLLEGIELADSFVWDAHKMLRSSALCTGVLFRRAADLDHAFRQRASYIIYEESPYVDLATRSFETTKTALGLKLFLNLAWRGEQAMGDYVAAQYDKARRFHARIAALPSFECPYEPQSNILCFRHQGEDELQLHIRTQLMQRGDFHISSTEIRGRRYLRLSVMSPATTEETIDTLIAAIEEITEGYAARRGASMAGVAADRERPCARIEGMPAPARFAGTPAPARFAGTPAPARFARRDQTIERWGA